MTHSHDDLLNPPTLLPVDPATDLLARGDGPADVAAVHPESSLVWAMLAEAALADDRVVEAYAYARTGYHRGLDALRRSGWRGTGRVPWSHVPNQGFLRSLRALGEAAEVIDEQDEAQRCAQLLADLK